MVTFPLLPVELLFSYLRLQESFPPGGIQVLTPKRGSTYLLRRNQPTIAIMRRTNSVMLHCIVHCEIAQRECHGSRESALFSVFGAILRPVRVAIALPLWSAIHHTSMTAPFLPLRFIELLFAILYGGYYFIMHCYDHRPTASLFFKCLISLII